MSVAQEGQPAETIPMSEEELIEEEPEPGCTGPQGLCPPELNKIIYRILTSEIEPQISCSGDRLAFYKNSAPTEADFTYKADYEFVYREPGQQEFMASSTVKLRYSQWGPAPSENSVPPTRLLLIHDALDSRKGWWCCQRLLSPFIDTISVDLLGSGESSKPRGINLSSSSETTKDVGMKAAEGTEEETTELVPWSYEFHAQYLIEMIRILWPTEKVYIAGVGWGAQIGITMASMYEDIAGVIMINPPGLTKSIHPELAYLGIYHLAQIPSDELLESSHVSILHLIREALIRNLHNQSHQAPINLILEQYNSLDRKRILIDQLISMTNFNYQELPRIDDNVYGLQIENIKAPILVISGEKDSIYPQTSNNLYPLVYYNTSVEIQTRHDVGHFIQLDRPEDLSEMIIDFIRQNVGVSGLKSIFFGFGAAGQSSEQKMFTEFEDLYKLRGMAEEASAEGN